MRNKFKNLTKQCYQTSIIKTFIIEVLKKVIIRFESKNNISFNVFGFENEHVYLFCFAKENFENHMDLLLIGSIGNSQGYKS